MVFDYIDKVKNNGYFQYRRNQQAKYWMYESINEQLKNGFYHNKIIKSLIPQMEQAVLDGKMTSFIAAHQLLYKYYDELKD